MIPDIKDGIEAPFGNLLMLVTTGRQHGGSPLLPVEGADELPMIIVPHVHREGEELRTLSFVAGLDVNPDIPRKLRKYSYVRTGTVVC